MTTPVSSPDLSRHEDNPNIAPELKKPFQRRRPKKPNLQIAIESLGGFLAIAYGALCGMGINARVLATFDSVSLAYAIGSVTFFVNAVLFWTVVPAMFVKLFMKQDLFDESFAAKTKDGKERYIKLNRNGIIEQLKFWPWQEGFSIRPWIILSFVMFFGLAAGLAYTGLLMLTLPSTLEAIGLTSFLPLTQTLGFFFAVSAACNWAFNSYDAAEQFSKNDFFEKFKQGVYELLLIKPNPGLLLEGETLDTVGFYTMRARQLVRLTILVGIAFLGVFALYSVAHIGTLGLFSYLTPTSIMGPEGILSIAQYGAGWIQALKWTTIIGSIVGGGFLFGVQMTRFSTMATQMLSKLALHYISFADPAPTPFLKFITLTVCSPLIGLYMLYEGCEAVIKAEEEYFSKAIHDNTSLMTHYQEEWEDFNDDLKELNADAAEITIEAWWQTQSFLRRATHDANSCWSEFYTKRTGAYAILGALTGIIATALVFAFHFTRNNIHALGAINASAQGLLAVKPGTPVSDNMAAAMGSSTGSAMCYTNNLAQKNDQALGVSTDKQEFYLPDTLLYVHRAKRGSGVQYMNLNGDESSLDSLKDADIYVDDPDMSIAKRFYNL